MYSVEPYFDVRGSRFINISSSLILGIISIRRTIKKIRGKRKKKSRQSHKKTLFSIFISSEQSKKPMGSANRSFSFT